FDASGRNNNGTLVNSPTRVMPGARGGRAISFDGINDYVEIGNPPDLQITGSITIALRPVEAGEHLPVSAHAFRRADFESREITSAFEVRHETGNGSGNPSSALPASSTGQ
ncbi:MAG: hypothetical protein HY646_05650, partial [Acidobacteria bacterium]|nr:hypothetical protein [Acidobacteriota bacterium]